MSKFLDTQVDSIKDKIKEADSKKDLMKWNFVGWRNGEFWDYYKLFGGEGIVSLYETQKKWIESGKPATFASLNYFDWDDKNIHQIYKLLKDFERDLSIRKNKEILNKMKKDKPVLDIIIKSIQFVLKDARVKADLREVVYLGKSARDWLKELVDLANEDEKVSGSDRKKIEKVVDAYNKKYRSLSG